MRTFASEQTQQVIYDYQSTQVKLLVGPLRLPPNYTRAGKLAKQQPDPLNIGDTVHVKVRNAQVNLYPFEMAGEGYELIRDAQGKPQHAVEGIHYQF